MEKPSESVARVCPRELPRITIKDVEYYVDDQLMQLRKVEDPFDAYELQRPVWSADHVCFRGCHCLDAIEVDDYRSRV